MVAVVANCEVVASGNCGTVLNGSTLKGRKVGAVIGFVLATGVVLRSGLSCFTGTGPCLG